MERPTPSEKGKTEHNRIKSDARELGERATALARIDAAMREQDDIWESMQRWAGCDGFSPDQLLADLWRRRNGSESSGS